MDNNNCNHNCNHKFFGSKLNTALLLVLIILLGVTIYLIKQNKIETLFDKQFIQDQEQKQDEGLGKQKQKVLLKFCPDELFADRMPILVKPGEKAPIREYYIYKGQRYEVADFDATWVKSNCNIKENIVY